MALTVGIKHLRDGVEPQNVIGAEMSVIGIIGTASGANAGNFPLNTPVSLRTNDTALRASLGDAGTLPKALAGISAQLAGSARAAKTVIVRIAEGANVAETIANILGNEANRTGMWAFLDAPQDLALTPRIIIAPGFTSQVWQGLANPVIVNGGGGGTDGTFALAFTGGTGSGAAGSFTVAGGVVTAVSITQAGNYTAAPTLSFAASAGLAGANVTVSLDLVGNPIVTGVPTILERLQAVFIPEGPSGSHAAWVAYLETVPASIRILHPLRQDAKVLDADGDIVTAPLSPYIAALYARRDSERDGVPSGSICNQSVYGLVGVSPGIHLSLTDETSEGQGLLELSGGIVVRGEAGVDDSPGSTGFTFWGTDTMAEESEWLFAHVARMRDYIELGNVRAQKAYLGKQNITIQVVEAVLNTLRMWLSRLAADDHILSPFDVGFERDHNAPEELRNGEIDISFRAEEPPVLRKMIIRSRRHRAALDALVQQISVRLGTGTAS